MSDPAVPAGWRGPSLKRTLSGKVPVFLVHKSVQNSARLGEVFEDISNRHGKALGVGTVVRLPGATPKVVDDYMARHSDVPLRVVDPELWTHPGNGWPGAPAALPTVAANNWKYLTQVPGGSISPSWVKTVLDIQKDHGATVLLSANAWLNEANSARSLKTAMDYLHESRQAAGLVPMWANLTMDARWLTDSSLRNRLLDEIVESNERDWYLRFWWPEVPVRYGQLTDNSVLDGYKALVGTAAVEGKRVYLPNTGLSGWIGTALGATGYSTGPAWPEQAFARQRRFGGRKDQPPPPRIPRLFDSMLLHTLDANEYRRLSTVPGHKAWSSPFSTEIESQGHSPERAGLHYLAAAARLTAKLNGPRPNHLALKRTRDARTWLKHVPRTDLPIGINNPTHLPLWEPLLR